MINVAVLGARGRMGSEVVKAVEATDGLALVAALDLGDSLEQLSKALQPTLLWISRHQIA